MSRLKRLKAGGEQFFHRLLFTPLNRRRLRRNGEEELFRLFRLGGLSPPEERWRERIEALRRDLLSSSRAIEVVDYGARSARLELSAADMYRGATRETTVGEVCRVSSNSPRWGEMIFRLIRYIQPRRCLELGCSLGLTAAYQGAALRLNGQGNLVTLEGSPVLASLARENLKALGLEAVEVVEGRFQDLLPDVLGRCGPVDFAFIDGHHDEEATRNYFRQIRAAASPKAWFVLDDISWSKGMKAAWREIITDKEINLAIDLFKLGICRRGGLSHPVHYRLVPG